MSHYHTITPLVRFSMLNIFTVGIASVSKRSGLGISRRELSQDVSCGVGILLIVEQSTFENRPTGGVVYTVLYGAWYQRILCWLLRRVLSYIAFYLTFCYLIYSILRYVIM